MEIKIDLKRTLKDILDDKDLVDRITSLINDLDRNRVKSDVRMASDSNFQNSVNCSASLRSESLNGQCTRSEMLRTENENLLKNELDKFKNKYEQLEKEHEIIRDRFRCFNEFIEIYEQIIKLEGKHKEYLQKLCKTINVNSILSLGSNENKINQLHDYVQVLAVSNSETEQKNLEILVQYMDFCINFSNSLKDDANEKILKIIPDVGELYDSRKYIKTSSSKQIGVVSKVIMPSYSCNGKVKYQSVVEVS